MQKQLVLSQRLSSGQQHLEILTSPDHTGKLFFRIQVASA